MWLCPTNCHTSKHFPLLSHLSGGSCEGHRVQKASQQPPHDFKHQRPNRRLKFCIALMLLFLLTQALSVCCKATIESGRVDSVGFDSSKTSFGAVGLQESKQPQCTDFCGSTDKSPESPLHILHTSTTHSKHTTATTHSKHTTATASLKSVGLDTLSASLQALEPQEPSGLSALIFANRLHLQGSENLSHTCCTIQHTFQAHHCLCTHLKC